MRLCGFLKILITSEYALSVRDSLAIPAKLVTFPHNVGDHNPTQFNCYFDYGISDKMELSRLDYSYFPNQLKLHANTCFTQLAAGSPKIDLLCEQRKLLKRNYCHPVLLIYPIDFPLSHTPLAEAPGLWQQTAEAFLKLYPGGLAVFRPYGSCRAHFITRQLTEHFADESRFVMDMEDDNKFWLTRADFFITDQSDAYINWCVSSLKPAIRYDLKLGGIRRDEWGWLVQTPEQAMAKILEAGRDEEEWAKALNKKRHEDFPTLGHSFELLAEMIQRIYNDDDDPAWPKMAKGNTPCASTADILRLTAKNCRSDHIASRNLQDWLFHGRDYGLPQDVRTNLIMLSCFLATNDWCGRVAEIFAGRQTIASLRANPMFQVMGIYRHRAAKMPVYCESALLTAACLAGESRYQRGRCLFLFIMEAENILQSLERLDAIAAAAEGELAASSLKTVRRWLPIAARFPRWARRLAALPLALCKPLAKRYYRACAKLAKKGAGRRICRGAVAGALAAKSIAAH